MSHLAVEMRDVWTAEEVKAAIPDLTEKLTSAVVAALNGEKKTQTESIVAEEHVPLIERVIASDGTFPIRLIRPGWGSSGYYKPEVLERDGARAWPKGTKMYANHPSLSEERDRPERDIRDIAAVLTEDPVFRHDPRHGPGLYSRAKAVDTWRPQIEALASSPAGLDLSIRADGTAISGEAEGRKGRIVERIDKGRSVDFVTDGGAGGKVVSLSESARTLSEPLNNRATCEREGGTWDEETGKCTMKSKETSVAEAQQLQEAQAALAEARAETAKEKQRADRAETALTIREARDVAFGEIAKTRLPDVTKTRIVDSVSLNPPLKDGKVDKDALVVKLGEAVKAEAAYLKAATGSGAIRGMGASTEADRDYDKDLTEAFTEMGFDEKTAAKMAAGRGN